MHEKNRVKVFIKKLSTSNQLKVSNFFVNNNNKYS